MQKFHPADTDAWKLLERLIKVSDAAIADLRRHIGGLQDGSVQEGVLLLALQRLGQRFAETTGIAVHVKAEGDICLNDRLAAEVFQMVAEGLSNVRRHTHSPWATVSLACHNEHLIMRIENAGMVGEAPVSFTPRSIAGRAAAIGGHTRVERSDTGSTVVLVDIPL